MKKVLVTGAAGFIGFYVCLALKKRGDFVVGYDNFNAYYDINLKKARANELKKQNISVIHGDINEQKHLINLIQEHKITHIIHLAAQAGVRHSINCPEEYVYSNLTGFVSLMEVCKQFPHIPLIYASSSSVYGLNKKIPFNSADHTDQPANLYGATKKANELIAHAYHHLFKIKMTGLRFFTVYGPWGRPDMAYYLFTDRILAGKTLNLFNHGEMKRDFTYIDDIVEGILSALDHGYDFEIFNLGNHNPEPVMKLVKYLETSLNKQALINLLPMPQGELVETFADIDMAAQKLGFKPKTTFEQGMEKFLDWYKAYYHF